EVAGELVVLGPEEVVVGLELGLLAVERVGDVDGRLVALLLPGGHGVVDPDLAFEAAGGDGDGRVPGESRRGQPGRQEQRSQADGRGRSEAEAGPHCCRAPFAYDREKAASRRPWRGQALVGCRQGRTTGDAGTKGGETIAEATESNLLIRHPQQHGMVAIR